MVTQNILNVKNKEFPLIKEQMKWQGEGTQNDPVVIDFINQAYTDIYFRNINEYVHLNGFKNKKLGFKSCQNFQIEDCSINALVLVDCRNFSVKNNIVAKVVSLHSGECLFTENTIVREYYEKVKKGYFNRKYLRKLLYPNVLFFWALFTFLYGMVKTPIATFEYFAVYLIGFLMMIPFILLFFLKPVIYIMKSRKILPHEFENNKIINQEQFNLSFTIQPNLET